MKFLVIGLGSMGQRRIRDLQKLGENDIVGFDPNEKRCEIVEKLYNINTWLTFKRAILEKPDVFIISTPPDKHLQYQQSATVRGIPFFTEASISKKGLKEVIKFVSKNGIVGVPSATMRFNQDIKHIKEDVQKKPPLTFTYAMNSWLPDWHSGADPNEYYAYKTGAREMVPFELEWLVWVFGNIKKIKGFHKGVDVYQIIMEFENGIIGHAQIDVITKSAGGGQRHLVTDNNAYWIGASEDMYLDEIKHFLKALKGEVKYHYTLEDDLKILNLLEEIERDGEV